jgi:hypothetical protein
MPAGYSHRLKGAISVSATYVVQDHVGRPTESALMSGVIGSCLLSASESASALASRTASATRVTGKAKGKYSHGESIDGMRIKYMSPANPPIYTMKYAIHGEPLIVCIWTPLYRTRSYTEFIAN